MSSVRIDEAPEGERNPSPAERGRPRYFHEDPRVKSPALTTVLSLVPGLGQIYLGYYGQGFLNIAIVASIITILAGEYSVLTPFLGIFLGFYWLYNIVDAYRRATLYNHALEGLGPTELPDIGIAENRGSMFWGVVLIIAGGVGLSHTAWGYSLAWLERWWPVALVLAGLYLIYKSFETRSKEKQRAR